MNCRHLRGSSAAVFFGKMVCCTVCSLSCLSCKQKARTSCKCNCSHHDDDHQQASSNINHQPSWIAPSNRHSLIFFTVLRYCTCRHSWRNGGAKHLPAVFLIVYAFIASLVSRKQYLYSSSSSNTKCNRKDIRDILVSLLWRFYDNCLFQGIHNIWGSPVAWSIGEFYFVVDQPNDPPKLILGTLWVQTPLELFHLGVSKNRGTPKSSIIHFNRVFHCKPSILGYPYFWNTHL